MSEPFAILGIDPGLGGALALYLQFAPPHIGDMPQDFRGEIDAFALSQMIGSVLKAFPHVRAFIEDVHSRPRQAGVFNFGLGAGILRGVLAAHGIPFTLVSPAKWKPAMGLKRLAGETQAENKSRARALAAQLFPAEARLFQRVKDDGRAEALLIAVYGSSLKEVK